MALRCRALAELFGCIVQRQEARWTKSTSRGSVRETQTIVSVSEVAIEGFFNHWTATSTRLSLPQRTQLSSTAGILQSGVGGVLHVFSERDLRAWNLQITRLQCHRDVTNARNLEVADLYRWLSVLKKRFGHIVSC